jgi:hypothetical protein
VTLFPLTHAHVVRSPREAAALFKALGEKTVDVRGCYTTDATKIARVVAAVATKRDHQISFERGAIAPAREALRELALSRAYGYLDVRTRLANLRIWPDRYSWVTSDAPTFETTSIAAALERFEMLAGEPHDRGFITFAEPAKPLVTALIVALGAEMHAALEVELPVAIELAEVFAGESFSWAAARIAVRFPSGEISGFLTTPDPKPTAKWHAWIDKAVRRANRP